MQPIEFSVEIERKGERWTIANNLRDRDVVVSLPGGFDVARLLPGEEFTFYVFNGCVPLVRTELSAPSPS